MGIVSACGWPGFVLHSKEELRDASDELMLRRSLGRVGGGTYHLGSSASPVGQPALMAVARTVTVASRPPGSAGRLGAWCPCVAATGKPRRAAFSSGASVRV